MEKDRIKAMLRETLLSPIKEEGEKEPEGGENNKTFNQINNKAKKKVQTLTKKIHNATQGDGKLLKLSQVMQAAGVGDADSATDRSAIGKAVSGKPDADGKIRHLSVADAARMGAVVDNPTAFK